MDHKPGPKGGSVYDEDIPSSELTHWGRKGMKWGIRKEYSKETQSKIKAADKAKAHAKKADDAWEGEEDRLPGIGATKATKKDWDRYNKALDANINAHRKANALVKAAKKAKRQDFVKEHPVAVAATALVVAKIALNVVGYGVYTMANR